MNSHLQTVADLFLLILSWEQIGQWSQAQVLYESAQITARSGAIPFTESEMALWEDHWIITAQKLQQVSNLDEFLITGPHTNRFVLTTVVGYSC